MAKNILKLIVATFILMTTAYAGETPIKKGKPKYKRYLSAVAIFRDEADYLKEWIEYHRLQGVEYFYLYNNLSNDHYEEVLKEYVDNKIVKLIKWPFEHNEVNTWDRIQTNSYKDAIRRTKNSSKWLMILDTDEFFVPNQHESVADLLRDKEKQDPHGKYAAYYFFWVVFGTSGVEKVPNDRLMIEMLTMNSGPHELYKCIARPKYIGNKINPHWVRLAHHKEGIVCPLELLQINHYMYRDGHFLKTVKIPRREKFGTDSGTLLYWESCCNQENIYSDKILRFIPEMKRRMGFPE